MKLNAQKYAEILYEALEASPGQELVIIRNFVKFLFQQRQLSLFKRIIYAFDDLYNRKNNIKKIKIKTAQDFAGEIITEKFGKKIEIEKKVDQNLIGGAIFQIDNLMIDGSLRNKLISLHKQICQ